MIFLERYTSRREILRFGPQDLVVLGSPVYAGRLPNKILPELETVLQKAGFRILVGAALVGRHAFTDA